MGIKLLIWVLESLIRALKMLTPALGATFLPSSAHEQLVHDGLAMGFQEFVEVSRARPTIEGTCPPDSLGYDKKIVCEVKSRRLPTLPVTVDYTFPTDDSRCKDRISISLPDHVVGDPGLFKLVCKFTDDNGQIASWLAAYLVQLGTYTFVHLFCTFQALVLLFRWRRHFVPRLRPKW